MKRGEAKKADFNFSYKPNIPLAILEAKDNNHSVGDGTRVADAYISPIWYPEGEYQHIEKLLQLLLD